MMVSSIAAPITANQTLAAASAVFTWAISMDIITVNPCRGVEGNPTKSRSRVLSDDEIKKFWKAFDTAGLVRGSALRLILLLGQRPGETRHMRREHIVDNWWMMPGPKMPDIGWPGTKNGEDHHVWLPAPARRIVDELIAGEAGAGFVLATEKGGPVSGLDADMRRICRDIGIPNVRPHDLRRTFGTTVTGLGLGRQCMDRLLNHADHSIASVYDRHEYRREDQAAWERVAGHIMSLVDGRVTGDNVVQFAPPA
jgi:integrase